MGTVRDHWKSPLILIDFGASDWFFTLPEDFGPQNKSIYHIYLNGEDISPRFSYIIAAILFRFTAIAVNTVCIRILLRPNPLARPNPWNLFISAFFGSIRARVLYRSRKSLLFVNWLCSYSPKVFFPISSTLPILLDFPIHCALFGQCRHCSLSKEYLILDSPRSTLLWPVVLSFPLIILYSKYKQISIQQ